MYILGISPDHNASAALLKDDKVIACVSEERFNRIKNFFGLPVKSIDYCLEFAGINPSDLDLVVVASEVPPPIGPHTIKDSKSTPVYNLLKTIQEFLIEDVEWKLPFVRQIDETAYGFVSKLLKKTIDGNRKMVISQTIGVEKNKIKFVDHHLCHASTAVYGSPFINEGIDKILIFTADAEGDGLAATVSLYEGGNLQRLSKTSQNNSAGGFYSAITQYLGMKPGEHEYKVMGLAPYASEKDIERIFNIIKDWILVDHKTLEFKTIVNSHTFVKLCKDKLQMQRFDWIAGGAQKLLEVRMLEWIEAAIKKTGVKNVVASGGVFMNVKLNKLISSSPNVRNFFVFPSSGDESNAFGTCYVGFKKVSQSSNPQPIKDLYLGPVYDLPYVQKVIKNIKGFKVTSSKNIELDIAKLLSKGEIVARFTDRSEWGARALGNRSILADASKGWVVEKINKMIKNRDFWMPFAPIILDEDKNKYLKYLNNSNGYYMMMAYDTKDASRDDMVAAIHPYDKTARAQILLKEFNPDLWKIVNNFKKITGRGVLLNTSFNLHGEPIVGSPEDAIDVFKRSGLKYLALGPYLIAKE